MTIDCVLSGMETSGEDKWVGERERERERVCVCVKKDVTARVRSERGGQTCTKFWMPVTRDGGWPC